jgi:uncharacterized membrane protein
MRLCETSDCFGLWIQPVDAETGRKLATVFIPSTPNVGVGETRVLPFDQLTMTNWTVSDAITFLMSGGAVSPSKIHFDKSAPE